MEVNVGRCGSLNAWDWSPLFAHADDHRRAKCENWTFPLFLFPASVKVIINPFLRGLKDTIQSLFLCFKTICRSIETIGLQTSLAIRDSSFSLPKICIANLLSPP